MHRLAITISNESMDALRDLPIIPPDHIPTIQPLHAEDVLPQLALELGKVWLT
jgi:hypothetical protein